MEAGFDYSSQVQEILALAGSLRPPMPLAGALEPPAWLRRKLEIPAAELFPGARSPEGALSGLWLYYSCLEEAHQIAQNLPTREGSFWHGIMHRREPDPGNAAYWFRRVGAHAIFPALLKEARLLADSRPAAPAPRLGDNWDPFVFIDYCEQARRGPGSEMEQLAMEIQLAEWKLLFDYCARPAR